MSEPTLLERAYALARSGECSTLDDIRRQLKSEKYESVDAHVTSPSVRRDLRQLCLTARMHPERG